MYLGELWWSDLTERIQQAKANEEKLKQEKIERKNNAKKLKAEEAKAFEDDDVAKILGIGAFGSTKKWSFVNRMKKRRKKLL